MPPASKKRRTSGPANAQGTLNFRNTKSSAANGASPYFKPKKQVSTPSVKPEVVDVTTDDSQSQSQQQPPAIDIDDTTARIFQTAEEEVDGDGEAETNEEDELTKKALALPESKIKAYWAAKEKERKAPRVHQKELTMREKMLREFDMSSRYGPSMGISRLARWKRAYRLEMQPPIEILAVLLKEDKSAKDTGDKAAEVRVQRSVMDDLIMSSRMKAEIET